MTMKNKQKRKKNPRSARPHPRREHQGEHAYLFYLHVAERKDAHSKVCSWYCCDELDLHVAVHLLAVTWPVLVTLSLKDTNKYTLNMCITVSLYPSTIKRNKDIQSPQRCAGLPQFNNALILKLSESWRSYRVVELIILSMVFNQNYIS